jgi:hypothetical protein
MADILVERYQAALSSAKSHGTFVMSYQIVRSQI